MTERNPEQDTIDTIDQLWAEQDEIINASIRRGPRDNYDRYYLARIDHRGQVDAEVCSLCFHEFHGLTNEYGCPGEFGPDEVEAGPDGLQEVLDGSLEIIPPGDDLVSWERDGFVYTEHFASTGNPDDGIEQRIEVAYDDPIRRAHRGLHWMVEPMTRKKKLSAKEREERAAAALQPARQRLAAAIITLTEPQPHTIDHKIVWIETLYHQLADAVHTQRSLGGAVAKSRPPFWVDAEDLLIEIDTAVTAWEPPWPIDTHDPIETPTEPTILRLRAIQRRKWRPQDCRSIDQISGCIESWCQAITRLLTDDNQRWRLAAPCPECKTRWVYRDQCGEKVRTAALKLTTEACTCQHCHTAWPKERFQILAAMIGYPLPDGVVT